MEETEIERWLFVALACVFLIGLMLRVWASGECASTFPVVLARIGSDVLVFFGGIGSAGLLCIKLFGPARVERTLFSVFLAVIIGAAILLVRGA